MQDIEKYIVTGIGELLWDILPETKVPGGAPANFAIHARKLGAETTVISAIGNDKDGQDILEFLEKKGVNTRHIPLTSSPTGTVNVIVDELGKPDYTIAENSAWDYISLPEKAQELAGECHAVCFGSLAQRNKTSRESIGHFLKATSSNCLRIFDINLRKNYYSPEIITNSLVLANVVKLNDEELLVLQKMFDLSNHTEQALQELLERFDLRHIALTLGAQGSIMLNQEQIHHQPGIKNLTIRDTIGAGDSFTAAMCMGLLHNMPLATINKLSGSIAAFVCTQAGATPDLPGQLIHEFERFAGSDIIKPITPLTTI
ncbi:MAG: carbohydrate kinase [Sedimentisphaerales bacterium]|nr:carbohydrate kinase [Sedimentisphaerales bacterium]